MFKRRNYLNELHWYFDEKNHTKLDRIEIFIRYTLLSPRSFNRMVVHFATQTYYKILLKYFTKVAYTSVLYSGIDKHYMLKFKKGYAVHPGEYKSIYKVHRPTYNTLSLALDELNNQISEGL